MGYGARHWRVKRAHLQWVLTAGAALLAAGVAILVAVAGAVEERLQRG